MPVYSYDDRAEASRILSSSDPFKGSSASAKGGASPDPFKGASAKGSDGDDDDSGSSKGSSGGAFKGAQTSGSAGTPTPEAPTKTEPVKRSAQAETVRRTFMAPFRNNDGSYDLKKAVQSRVVSTSTMRKAGFTDAQITAAATAAIHSEGAKALSLKRFLNTKPSGRAGAKLEEAEDPENAKPTSRSAKAKVLRSTVFLPFRNDDGTYDLKKAVESRVIGAGTMREAGFSEKQILAGIVGAIQDGDWAHKRLVIQPFKGAGTGGTTGSETERDVDGTKAEPTSRGAKAAALRSAVFRKFKNDDGSYNLQEAVETRMIGAGTMRRAGFGEPEILAAIVGAINSTAPKFGDKDLSRASAELLGMESMSQKQREKALADVMATVHAGMKPDPEAQKRTLEAMAEASRTRVAMPGEKTWYHRPTGATISNEEYKRITDNGRNSKADDYTRSAPEVRRGAIEATATLFFLPARAGLPEVDRSEIKKEEYAIGAAQMASWLAPMAPKGVGGVMTGASAGVFGATTAKNWDSMTKTGRAVSVAATALLFTASVHALAQPSFKPVKVPLKDGSEAVVWSGLSSA